MMSSRVPLILLLIDSLLTKPSITDLCNTRQFLSKLIGNPHITLSNLAGFNSYLQLFTVIYSYLQSKPDIVVRFSLV